MPKKKEESATTKETLETSSGISVTVIKELGCQVKIQADLPISYNEVIWKEAIKGINKEVSLPGFRRGKAPEAYIVKKYPTHLAEEFKRIASNRAFQEILLATKLSPLQQEGGVNASWQKNDPKELCQITYEFESTPLVPDVDYNSLEIVAPPLAQVSDEEFEKELAILAQRSSQQKECDAPAKQGSWVDLKTETVEGGSELYAGKRFECKEGAMPKELFDLVLGMKAGESKEAELTDPKSTSEEKVPSKVTLEKVYEMEAPTIDDNFAKSMGLKDLEDLKTRLRDNMQHQKNFEYDSALLQVIQTELVKKIDFDLPSSFLEQEKKNLVQTESVKWQQEHKKEPEGSDLEAIEAKALETARERVKSLFAIHQIAEREQVQVDRKQVEEMMQPYLGQLSQEKDQERLKAAYSNLYSQCHMHLLTQNTLKAIAKKLELLTSAA